MVPAHIRHLYIKFGVDNPQHASHPKIDVTSANGADESFQISNDKVYPATNKSC